MLKVISNIFKFLLNLIKNLATFVFYYVFCLIYILDISVRYIFKKHGAVSLRIFLAFVYTFAGVFAIQKSMVFFVFVAFLAIFVLALAVSLMIGTANDNNEEAHNQNGETENNQNSGFSSNSFFNGLSPEEAKKVYRNLMREYHPDNPNGDLEMTKKINAEYHQKYQS